MSKKLVKKATCWFQFSVLSVTTSILPLIGGIIKPAQASNVPTCVNTKSSIVGFRHYVTVQNNCNSSQRVKIIWANASDGSCITYRPGASIKASRLRPGRFSGLRKC